MGAVVAQEVEAGTEDEEAAGETGDVAGIVVVAETVVAVGEVKIAALSGEAEVVIEAEIEALAVADLGLAAGLVVAEAGEV